MGAGSIENNAPYLETWRTLMLSMLKKINQEESVAALPKVIVHLPSCMLSLMGKRPKNYH